MAKSSYRPVTNEQEGFCRGGTRQGPLEDAPVRGKPSEEGTLQLRPVGKGAAESLR